MLLTVQCVKPPLIGASGSWTTSRSWRVPAGTPEKCSSGVAPRPSHVYCFGIGSPFAKTRLEICKPDAGCVPVVGATVCALTLGFDDGLLPLLHAAATSTIASALLDRRTFVIVRQRIDGDRIAQFAGIDGEPETAEIRDDRVHV